MNKTEKSKELPSIKHVLKNNAYALNFVWKNSKTYLLFSIINTLISGFFSPWLLFLTSCLFDLLELRSGFNKALDIILIIILSVVCYASWILIYHDVFMPRFNQKMNLKVQSELFEKVRRMELSKYDDPEFYNDFILTMKNADSHVISVTSNLNRFFGSILGIGAKLALLVYVDWVVMFLLLLSTILTMLLDIKLGKLNYNLQISVTPINRKKDYIDRVHKQPNYAKELRMTDFGDKLIQDYEKNTADYCKIIKDYGKKTVLFKILEALNGRSVFILIIAWTIYKMAIIGSVTLGGFSIVITASSGFQGSLVNFFRMFSSLADQSLYIEKVRSFMEYEPKGRTGVLETPTFEEFEVKGLSFNYSEDVRVLHGINMKIRRGEKIAIVGYNGAGKSTLVKLLMHLYQPTEGAILYNGVDIREYETDSYRAHIGAVFQDFKLFAATIAENVLGGEYTEDERGTVERALELATFDNKLGKLPNGINTMLTREFDEEGIELSGGEAQKIAIARVFAKPFEIVIMDEPSSALDPEAEYNLNKNIYEYAEDKTVIFISHRLSTTRHADRIYMFEEGRIIESGSHDELMLLNGKYAEMFNVQSEKYKMK